MELEMPADDKSFFKKGTFVEVSSNADGFNGVWYEAKVLEPPPPPTLTPSLPKTKKDRFYLIEYRSLLCDDGSGKALTEYVECSFVRPLPPSDEFDLQVNDVVDAMHLDGWWIGVVVRVQSNIYSVYFENPPELLKFKRHELRAHWDWEGGKWVRPQKQVAKFSSRILRHGKEVYGGMLQYEEQTPCSGTANPEETDIVANCKKLKSIANKKGQAGSLRRRRGGQQKTSAKGKKCDGSSDTVDVLVLKDYDSTDVKSPISTGESKRTKHDGAGEDVDKLVIKYHEIDDGLSTENMEESKVRKHDGAGSSVDKFAFKDHAIDADSAKNTGDSEGTKNDGAGGMLQYEKQTLCSGTANPEETDIVANCMKLKSMAKKKGRAGSLKRKRGEQQKTSAKGKKCDESSDTVDVLVLKDYDSTDVKSPISTGESKRTKHDGAGDGVDKLVIKYHENDDGLSTENIEEYKVRKHDGAGSSVDKFAFKDHVIGVDSAKSTGDSEGTKHDGAGGMLQYEEQTPCSSTANPEETDIVANCMKLKSMAKKKGRAGSLKRKRGEQQKTSAKGKKCDESGDTVDVLVLKDYDSTDVKSPISTGESKRTKHDGAGDDVDKLVIKYHEIDDGLSKENMEESKVRKHDGAGSSVDKFAFKDHAIDADSAKNTVDSEGTNNDGAGGDVTGESKHTKHDGAGDDVDKLVIKYHEIDDGLSTENMKESNVRKHDEAGSSVDKFAFKDHVIDADSAKNTGDSEGTKNDGAGGDVTGESKRIKRDGAGDDVDKLVIKYHEIDDGLSTENMEESKVRKHDGAGSSVDKFAFKDHAIDADLAKNTGDSEGTKNDGAGGDVGNMVLKYPVIIDAESPTNKAESKDKECDGAGVAVNKMDLQDCASNGVETSKMTGESTGSEDASAEKAANISDTGCSMREAEMAIVQLPVNMGTVAKPTSMWFDGLCYRKIVIDSRFLCGRTVNQNQRNKAKGKLIEIVKESTANDSVSDIIRDENQCFHGMEPSSMWKTFIESVEVLETIPQKPHFHPLKKCKEMYRDGIAFGYMITFAKLVKRTSELQVNDPKSIFHSISETLQDIELYGFDVQPIRNRLTELQLMKDRQEQLQEASKEFEHQILEHTHEQMKINAEFAEVDEEMKLLEEKKRKIMLLMQEKDSKITELKSNLDVCNQDIQNSQLDFESLAAAPW